MSLFLLGLAVGFALGLVVIGFLALGAYERGFQDALRRRGQRIAELRARQFVAARHVAERATLETQRRAS